jgi:hypothetical protein
MRRIGQSAGCRPGGDGPPATPITRRPARAAYQAVVDPGITTHAPAAAEMLGDRLRRMRDFAGARACYEVAVAADHYARSALARRRLARRWRRFR